MSEAKIVSTLITQQEVGDELVESLRHYLRQGYLPPLSANHAEQLIARWRLVSGDSAETATLNGEGQ